MSDSAAAPSATQATVSDWLALHGVTVSDLSPVLELPPPPPPAARCDQALTRPVTAAEIVDRLCRALPAIAPLLGSTLARARIDLAPDRTRFPRGFTLNNDGTGRPFISCPCDGTTADLFRLAHEIGHACQSIACPATVPPVQREAAAYLAEALLLTDARRMDDPLVEELATRHAADSHAIATRDGSRLARALGATGATYSYRWNYVPARAIAARALADWGDADCAALFTAPPPLVTLLARFRQAG